MGVIKYLALNGPIGIARRYLSTEKYFDDMVKERYEPAEMERRFYRDREMLRNVTLPVTAVVAMSGYAAPAKNKRLKLIAHFCKGYFTSEMAQIIAERFTSNKPGKFIIGLAAALGGSIATETLQGRDVIPGLRDETDTWMESYGGYVGCTLESFMDGKIAQSRLLRTRGARMQANEL